MEVAEEHKGSSILASEDERRRPQAWFLALLPVETLLPETVYMLVRIIKIVLRLMTHYWLRFV